MYFEVIKYFTKLGCLGFGGPFALIASMQKDLVEKKQWISTEKFNHVLPLIKSMPGPVAFQMATYLGYLRGGRWAGILAGFFLVLPAFILMVLFAWLESHISQFSGFESLFRGLQMGALGVIFFTCYNLSRGNEKIPSFWLISIISAVLTFKAPSWEPLWIVGLGFLNLIMGRFAKQKLFVFTPFIFIENHERLTELFLSCFKAGAFVFGSGLAIVPLMQGDFVSRLGWVNDSQFMNGLALGQITPGPVVITATYLGYHVSGFLGAVTATLGIFAASLFHMLTWFPLVVEKLYKNKNIYKFSQGALAAAIGAILAATIKIAMGLNINFFDLVLLIIVFALLFFKKLPIWAVIIMSGLVFYIV